MSLVGTDLNSMQHISNIVGKKIFVMLAHSFNVINGGSRA